MRSAPAKKRKLWKFKMPDKKVSNVLGMELSRALNVLEGLSCRIEETDPRSRQPVEGPLRVIRQKETEEGLLLTVCRVPAYEADC